MFTERTLVEIPFFPRPLREGEVCVLLGSCFSQYMGERMAAANIPVVYNPLGTLFNPASIDLLLRAMEDTELVKHSIFYAAVDEEWRSWLADTKLKGRTQEDCKAQVQSRLHDLRDAMARSSYFFVTLGTSVCYRLVEEKNFLSVVTNCHRQPGRMFVEDSLSQEQCEEMLNDIVQRVLVLNPDLQIVFTVSPYRYSKYTLHGSQLAKARLLLAVDAVCRQHPAVCLYFPAYEIVLDELRDYAFYAADRVHPSAEAADYIWQRLYVALHAKNR